MRAIENRRFLAAALAVLLAALAAPGARAEDSAPEGPDRAEIARLLEQVKLDAQEAVGLLALPEALQHRVLRALAGRLADGAFTTEDWILLRTLPRTLQARVLGRGREAPKPEEGEEERPAEPGKDGKPGGQKDGRETGDPPRAPKEEEGGETEEGEEPEGAQKELPAEPAPEPEYPLQEVDTDLAPFGAELFAEGGEEPPLAPSIAVPSDYVLGPGDILLVHYWNALADSQLTAEVTAEGRVVLPKAGEITVGGATLEAATRLLEKRIRDVYKDAAVLVTLHSLRSIRVFVAGEVGRPGLHTVSALGTVFHALYAAGGPSERGSYRRVQTLRGDRVVAEHDLYAFLREGRRGGDTRLLDGDTVFVPLAGARVAVAGKVRRPALYELRDEKTLADVLALAGGLDAAGDAGALRIERIEEGRALLLDVAGDPASQTIRDGDTVKVFPVFPDPLDRVEVTGSVQRPGRYQWREGARLSDLVRAAGGLLPDAHLGYAEIRRRTAREAGEGVAVGGRTWFPAWTLVRVDLAAALRDKGEADLPLKPLDHLYVPALADVNPKLTVEIRGAVEKPGIVEYARGMRVLDLLLREGQGLLPAAHLPRAEILRLTAEGRGYDFASGSQKTRARTLTLPVDLARALSGDGEANLPLMPFDVVKVYHAEEVRPAPTVIVLGAVRYPDTFELTSGMRVSDLVFKAGNITEKAYLERAEILRRVYDGANPISYRLETLGLDLGKALMGDAAQDLPLENFDRLIIRETSEYYVEVEVRGEVRFPGTYLMPKGARLTDLMERAGGYTVDAFLPGAFFTRQDLKRIQQEAKERFVADQKAKLIEMESQTEAWSSDPRAQAQLRDSIRTRRRLLEELDALRPVGRLAIRLSAEAEFDTSPFNLVLQEGDSLRIPQSPAAVTVQGEVFAPGSVLFTPGKRIEYFLNQVGGLREDADEGRIYMVKADGRAYPRSAQGAFSVRWDSENLRWVRNRLGRVVDAGDIIIVPPRSVVVRGYDLTKDIVDILYKIALSAGVLAGIAG